MLMFFSPKDKTTAVGMHTTTYFILLAVYLIIIIVSIFLTRKMQHKTVKKVIIGSAIFVWVTEIIKMLFYGLTYGIEKVEFIPLYYCSMFMYATILASFKNEHLKRAGLSFISFGGILGAIAFFCFPSAVIPNYHLWHYMTFRTMIFHSLMIYVGVLILITGYYKPKGKDFLNYAVFFLITFVLAYVLNNVNGTNLMYISKPLKIELFEVIYETIPNLYPFIFGLGNMLAPYGISYGIYWLIQNKLIKK